MPDDSVMDMLIARRPRITLAILAAITFAMTANSVLNIGGEGVQLFILDWVL